MMHNSITCKLFKSVAISSSLLAHYIHSGQLHVHVSVTNCPIAIVLFLSPLEVGSFMTSVAIEGTLAILTRMKKAILMTKKKPLPPRALYPLPPPYSPSLVSLSPIIPPVLPSLTVPDLPSGH